jgi:lysophospholipase L1-like esterase
MQRLQNMRMPRPLNLAPLGLVWLTVACGGAAGPATAGDAQSATQDQNTQTAAAAGSGAQPAAKSSDKSTASDQAKAPVQPAKKPVDTAASSQGTAGASAATTGASAGAPATQSPDAPAAGAAATSPDTSEQAAAGSGGAAGAAAGAAGSGALTEDGIDPLMPDWSKRPDLGKGEGQDVVTIGDSWMDYIGGGGGIQAGLDRAGTRYRHYALSGTTLLSGQIPSQYTQAKGAGADIKTVIMTGGGNDVMFSGGCNTAELCEMSVAQIQAGLDKLWTEMADDGVKDVIYIAYSADAGTAPTGTRPKDVKPVPICLTGRILCHNLQTTELVMGQLVDGIHPTAAANTRIAEALLKMMEERKMRR